MELFFIETSIDYGQNDKKKRNFGFGGGFEKF